MSPSSFFLALATACFVGIAHPAIAQPFVIGLVDSLAVAAPSPGAMRLPVTITMQAGHKGNLAAFQATLSWQPDRLRFDSLRAGGKAALSLTANTSQSATGVLTFNAYGPVGVSASTAIGYAYFTALLPGMTTVDLRVDVAGDELGRSILSSVRGRGLRLSLGGRAAPDLSMLHLDPLQ